MKLKKVRYIEIANGASGTIEINCDSVVDAIYFNGVSPALGGNLTITHSGTPSEQQHIYMIWQLGGLTLGAHSLNLFGYSVPERLTKANFIAHAMYSDGKWYVEILIDFLSSNQFLDTGNIGILVDDTTIELGGVNNDTIQIKDEGVGMDQLTDLPDTYIIIGGTGDRPSMVAVSGDVTISNTGVVTIGSGKISTGKIADDAVTLDKIQNMTLGTVLVGGVGNAPTLLAVSDTYMLIGTASGIAAVAISGDITITNAGVVSIGTNKITTAKIADANVTLDKLEALASGKIIVGDSGNRPKAVVMSGDATIDNLGAVTINSNAITASKLVDGTITAPKHGARDMTTYLEGAVLTKIVESAKVKALLDGTTNNLIPVLAGERILNIYFITQTASGVAATVEIGPDANARTAGADPDGILKAANANSADFYNSIVNTYRGALQAFGWFKCDDDGYLTIKSSADVSASAWVGAIVITYLPA